MQALSLRRARCASGAAASPAVCQWCGGRAGGRPAGVDKVFQLDYEFGLGLTGIIRAQGSALSLPRKPESGTWSR